MLDGGHTERIQTTEEKTRPKRTPVTKKKHPPVTWDTSPVYLKPEEEDALIKKTLKILKIKGKVTRPLLIRHLKVPQRIAEQILAYLEEDGILGPSRRSQPREILQTPDPETYKSSWRSVTNPRPIDQDKVQLQEIEEKLEKAGKRIEKREEKKRAAEETLDDEPRYGKDRLTAAQWKERYPHLRLPFSKDNQPPRASKKGTGRKPSAVKRFIKDNGMSAEDIKRMTQWCLPKTKKELVELASNERAPYIMRVFAYGLLKDLKTGKLQNTFRLMEKAYPTPKEVDINARHTTLDEEGLETGMQNLTMEQLMALASGGLSE